MVKLLRYLWTWIIPCEKSQGCVMCGGLRVFYWIQLGLVVLVLAVWLWGRLCVTC